MQLDAVNVSLRDSSNSSVCDINLVLEITIRSVGHLKEYQFRHTSSMVEREKREEVHAATNSDPARLLQHEV